METVKYFAYGSNMLHERLKERVPSARVLGRAELPGYVLRFNKLSADGSAKANVVSSGDHRDVVYGVLYELDPRDQHRLDRAEGLGNGYHAVDVSLRTAEGDHQAYTYVADPESIRNDLKPYEWYKGLVVAGAKQNQLPQEYVRRIESEGVAVR